MYHIPFIFSNRSLVLTPRLGDWPGFLQGALLLLALGGILFFLVRIYRQELRLLRRSRARLLLSLRCLVYTFIYLVLFTRPVLRHTTTVNIPSRVIVALDRSDSMSINDSQRAPIENLELARGLKLANDLVSDDRLTMWIEKLRNQIIPADKEYTTVLERMKAMTRTQLAERVLAPEGIGLLNALDKNQLELIGFSQSWNELPTDASRLRTALANDGRKTGSAYTDLKIPLKYAVEHQGSKQKGLLGIVVLSDGQHNWGEGPSHLADHLGGGTNRQAIPVYTVVCGAHLPPVDLAITSAKASPATVFKHGSAMIEVRLVANGIPPGRIKLTVRYPEVNDLPNRPPIIEWIDYDGSGAPAPVTIPVRMDRAARETMRISAEAEPASGEKIVERFPENNSKEVTINVAPDKAKVLVIDGEARWELHYLRTALLRDEMMETRSVVFDQPRMNDLTTEAERALKLPELTMPGGDDLQRNDCIILGDVSPEQLSQKDCLLLEKYVADRGGTLVILAGKRSMPIDFMNGDSMFTRLLPIDFPRVYERKDGFQVALTAEGKRSAFLRLEPDTGLNLERWNSLPPHYWAITGKARPGAVALAAIADPLFRVKGQETDGTLFARQNYGFGRVFFIGLDSTWRWRYKKGDLYHHRFWSQIIRWAASDRALITGNDFIRFGVREPVYTPDQEVEILVRLSDKIKKLSLHSMAGARFFRKIGPGKEESIALAKLNPHAHIPGELDGSQSNLPPGDYAMELVIPEIEDKLTGPDGKKLRTNFKILPPDAGEMLDLSTNWDRMKEIAVRSGGESYSADQAGLIIEKLKNRSLSETHSVDAPLVQSWWTLIPVLILLTMEWVIRRYSGLP